MTAPQTTTELEHIATLEARYHFGPAARVEIHGDAWRVLIRDAILLSEGDTLIDALCIARERNPSITRP